MHTFRLTLWIAITATMLFGCSKVSVEQLRTEQIENPMGIQCSEPRLSWIITSEKNDVMQTSYHILMASTPEKLKEGKTDIWDSKDVASDQSVLVAYEGPQLSSSQQVFWCVKVNTTQGESRWSEPAQFTMGLLDSSDWKGEWIGLDTTMDGDIYCDTVMQLNARYLRHEFESQGGIQRAIVHICGLGLYQLYINGERIGNDELTPTATDYRKTVVYNTYDITSQLREQNAIGVILGMGRYIPWRPSHYLNLDDMYGFPKLRMQIEITYADGTQQTIATDTSWRITNNGPIRFNHEYDGEDYDARLEMDGWNKTGYDDSQWQHTTTAIAPTGTLTGTPINNMRVLKTILAVDIKQTGDNTYIVNFGQNIAGRPVIKMHNLQEGDSVRMRFSEILTKNQDSLYTDNLRSAIATDHYVANGKENGTTYHVSFITHGFQYMEISGLPNASLNDFTAELIADNIATTGTFECSNATLNQIIKNAWWGIIDNYKGMPMDCCQRDERMPWLGDRTAGCYGEAFLFDNAALYSKWMNDICEAQDTNGNLPNVAPTYWRIMSPNMTWPAALPMGCDMQYRQFGNLQPMTQHYDNIARWLDYMMQTFMNQDSIITKDTWGDWCMPSESQTLIHSKDPSRITDGGLMGTAYYIKVSQMMKHYAALTGHDADTAKWQQHITNLTNAFNKTYLHISGDSVYYGNNTATSNVLPLAFDIVPAEHRQAVEQSLVNKITIDNNKHISCGVIGMSWIQRLLSSMGQGALAYTLATNTTWPSYGYMLSKGATTIWELWNGDTADPAMNSGNHVMLLGDLITWCFNDLAGIQASQPGYKHILIHPDLSIADLSMVNATYQSPYGTIATAYQRNNDGTIDCDITIPCNTTATIVLGDEVKEIGSGKHHFKTN